MRYADRAITGWDMTAALAMARAMGCEAAAAVLLPEIEGVMVAKLNEQRSDA